MGEKRYAVTGTSDNQPFGALSTLYENNTQILQYLAANYLVSALCDWSAKPFDAEFFLLHVPLAK